MSGTKYTNAEDTGRLDRALYKIQANAVALLLRIAAGEPRQTGEAASMLSLTTRELVKPREPDSKEPRELTPLGVDAIARIRERSIAGAGLGKPRKQTATERAISHSIGMGSGIPTTVARRTG